MVYGPPKELLSDNGTNLTGNVMKAYTALLGSKHRVTTPYHPRTNGKVEILNGILGTMLTKMLMNQPTILWDQYLAQATFATRVRLHTRLNQSPYYLLYGRQPRLTSDDNLLRPLAVTDEEFQANFDRITEMQHARIVANKALVDKAIKAQLIRNESVKDVGFREGQWVLVRAEARNKFEGRWYGPYRIDRKMLLGTYRLTDPQGNIVKTLINGQRLVTACVTDENINRLWNSSKVQGALRKRDIKLMAPSPEVAVLFEKENEDTMGYDELASIPKKEWKELQKRSGERSLQVGEGGNPSLPDVIHLKALEEGLKEGLAEETHNLESMARTDHEARNEAQQTVMESQSTREIEETHNRQTKTLKEETPLLD
jgi:hypothetical protein